MAQETEKVHGLTPDVKPTITLPGDEEVKLSVLLMAGHLVKDKLYSPTIFLNEVQAQEITGQNTISRHVGDAVDRQLAAWKRLYGDMTNVPNPRALKVPRVSFPTLALVIVLSVAVIIFYGQYNTILRDQVVAFLTVNSAYLVAFILIIFAIFIVSRLRRNKVSKQVSQ